jgi:hypothetical protein
MKASEFRRLIQEEVKAALTEADIEPVGPDGNKITDPTVLRNLNMAVKAVNSSLRSKLITILEDPEAAKALKSPAQRVALIGAIAIALVISEKEFGQIITKIKSVLKQSSETPNDQA